MLRHLSFAKVFAKGERLMKQVKGQLTKRDMNLIEYCLSHLPISSDIAATLFYPNKYIAQRRLTTIHRLNYLKRTERLIVNQPYVYYTDKNDLKNYPLSILLYDIRLCGFEIESYQFKDDLLTATIHKNEEFYKISATLENLPQVYKRLSLQ